MTSFERRRSDRVMLTIPLCAYGVDAGGESFEAPARTVALGRYGAQVQIPRPLAKDQTVHLDNLLGRGGAAFRVVRSLSSSTANGGDYVVECLDSGGNIWGIEFPPPAEGDAADAKALLECRLCHAVALLNLTGGEVEVLRTAGLVAKPCQSCNAISPWRYADLGFGAEGIGEMAPNPEEFRTQSGGVGMFSRPRNHRRICMQVPVRICDRIGQAEVIKTANVSRGGFSFASEKAYLVGELVKATFRGNTAGCQSVELRARIVRRQHLEGTNREIYGVHYEPSASSLSPEVREA